MSRVLVLASLAESLINFRGHLLTEITNRGHQVFACAPPSDTGIREQLDKLGVKFVPLGFNRTGLNVLGDLGYFINLYRLIARLQPDMVIGYTIKPVVYGSLAARLAKVPRTYSMITGLGYAFVDQTSIRYWFVNILVRILYKFGLSRNQTVFFQNPDDMKLFRDLRLTHTSVNAVLLNGSGVDLRFFAQVPLHIEPVEFLLIARLLRHKGIYEYIEAARIIQSRYSGVIFHLVGPFDTNPTAINRSEVSAWAHADIVRYHGETTDVRPYIARSNVYVLPSYREGTPRSVLEAMAMGRAIITTDAPGCRETVVPGENGILVPPRDPKALAQAMEKLILNRSLIRTMGQKSREIVEQKFDVYKVNKVILKAIGLLDEALA